MIPGNVTSDVQIVVPGNIDGETDPTSWSAGMTVEVMIQTAAGKQYPKVIALP